MENEEEKPIITKEDLEEIQRIIDLWNTYPCTWTAYNLIN